MIIHNKVNYMKYVNNYNLKHQLVNLERIRVMND